METKTIHFDMKICCKIKGFSLFIITFKVKLETYGNKKIYSTIIIKYTKK